METITPSKQTEASTATQLTDPKAVVEQFIECCQNLDFDGGFSLISDDCVYRNMPFHTARGKKRIVRDLTALGKLLNEFQVEMTHIAVNDNVVLTERIDTLAGKFFRADLKLMGVFVVEDGKITEWRDYFDWTASTGLFIKSMFAKLIPSSLRS